MESFVRWALRGIMSKKKDIIQKIDDSASFKPFLAEDYRKLAIVDLYAEWAGPCDAMREFYRQISSTIEGFSEICDVLQIRQDQVPFFSNYSLLTRGNLLPYFPSAAFGENYRRSQRP